MRPVILYASVEGQTLRICQQFERQLNASGLSAELLDVTALPADWSLDAYSHYILAASIRYGHHQPAMRRFVKRHQQALKPECSAFVSVNLTARKAEKNQPETNPYVQKFLRRSGWKPGVVGVFPGALRYSEYSPINRRIIQFIMKLTGGSTDLGQDLEYTDWSRVDRFGERLAAWIHGRE